MLQAERGVVVVQVALALVALLGTCALVVDHGFLTVARAQAQNAADAGALAGATALAFDSVSNAAVVEQSARAAVDGNPVWGEGAIVTTPVTQGSCTVPGTPPPPTRINTCVTVNVQRNQASGNPLPVFFGRLVGIQSQGVRARAIGTAVPANASACVWPIAIPDRWGIGPAAGTPPQTAPPWSPTSTFIKYSAYPTLAAPRNVYTPPSSTTPGDGFALSTATLNTNVALALSQRANDDFVNLALTPQQFVGVRVPRSDGGGFAGNLASCNRVLVHIGDTLPLDGSGTLASVLTAASARVGQDPSATWNAVTLRVAGSCTASTPPCSSISPRIVALPVFDVNEYEDTRRTGTPVIRIVNFVGFFIRQVSGGAILGNFMTFPGEVVLDHPTVRYTSAFLRAGVLYR